MILVMNGLEWKTPELQFRNKWLHLNLLHHHRLSLLHRHRRNLQQHLHNQLPLQVLQQYHNLQHHLSLNLLQNLHHLLQHLLHHQY